MGFALETSMCDNTDANYALQSRVTRISSASFSQLEGYSCTAEWDVNLRVSPYPYAGTKNGGGERKTEPLQTDIDQAASTGCETWKCGIASRDYVV